MKPYEIIYRLGRYTTSVIFQCGDSEDAEAVAHSKGYLPRGAVVLNVRAISTLVA